MNDTITGIWALSTGKAAHFCLPDPVLPNRLRAICGARCSLPFGDYYLPDADERCVLCESLRLSIASPSASRVDLLLSHV